MPLTAPKPRLIHTRRGGIVALCLTGWLAVLNSWNLLAHSTRQHHWPLDFDLFAYLHLALPASLTAGINLLFYAFLLGAGIHICRSVRGSERLLVAGWIVAGFLGVIQIVVSEPVLVRALQYAKTVILTAAVIAAVDILWRMPSTGYPRLASHTGDTLET
jgi:hypothetical protein